MNNSYTFYMDEQNNLVCMVENLHGVNYYLNRDALIKLRDLDTYNFNHSRVSRRDMTISNNILSVSFSNYRELFHYDLLRYAPRNAHYIENMVQKFREHQRKKKRIAQIQDTVKKVVITASVCTLLGLSTYGIINVEPSKGADLSLEPDENQVSIAPDYEMDSQSIITTQDGHMLIIDNLLKEPIENLEMLPSVTVGESLEAEIPVVQEEKIEENVAYLEFEHNRDSEKGDHAYDNYYELVEKYSNKWGVSPNIIMSMLTQESGGYSTNLMQIQFWSWKDQIISVYNFEAGKYEKLVLTDNPQEYERKYGDIITITESDLNNPITNISVGTVLFRESARVMSNHIGASIQCYNFGYGNMMKVLKETASQTGVSVDRILEDQENIDFVNYTHIIDAGDPNYLSNVMQYTNSLEEGFVIKEIDANGNIIENQVRIMPVSKMGR